MCIKYEYIIYSTDTDIHITLYAELVKDPYTLVIHYYLLMQVVNIHLKFEVFIEWKHF